MIDKKKRGNKTRKKIEVKRIGREKEEGKFTICRKEKAKAAGEAGQN